jgi:hypothetical protein
LGPRTERAAPEASSADRAAATRAPASRGRSAGRGGQAEPFPARRVLDGAGGAIEQQPDLLARGRERAAG